MADSDVSPFEIIHSGIVGKLLAHLTVSDAGAREQRIRHFLHVFLLCPVSMTTCSRHALSLSVFMI